MPSKFARTPITHKPLPWCKPAPLPPLPPGGAALVMPAFVIRWQPHPPDGAPRAASFYFPARVLQNDVVTTLTAKNGSLNCDLEVQWDSINKRLEYGATLYDGTTTYASVGGNFTPNNTPRPIAVKANAWAFTIPTGQEATAQIWE